jgi:hypothetical protein
MNGQNICQYEDLKITRQKKLRAAIALNFHRELITRALSSSKSDIKNLQSTATLIFVFSFK